MKNIQTIILTVLLSLGLSQFASAVCIQTGNTPEGGNIIDCPPPVQNSGITDSTNPGVTDFADEVNIAEGGGVLNDGQGVDTFGGNDIITSSGNVTSIFSQGIQGGFGNDRIVINGGILISFIVTVTGGSDDDTIIINAGNITSTDQDAVGGGDGNDIIIINGGFMDGDDAAVDLFAGTDSLTVNGGTLKSNNFPAILGDTGNDTITLNGGVYMPGVPVSVDLGPDDDSLTFGEDIDLNGSINCSDGEDTLVFAMGVPLNRIAQTTEAIENLTAPDGSISINGITYEYENCEEFVADLRQPEGLPIPTLSEWGLIAMAGILGLTGLMFAVRKIAAT